MDLKITNPKNIEQAEDYLEKVFNNCQYILNEDLKKVENQSPIYTDFKMDLNKKLQAKENMNDNTRKIEFSFEIFRKIDAFYIHMFSENNVDYYKMTSYDQEYNQEKADFYQRLLTEISVSFLMFHEFGHIYNGHLLYMQNEPMNDTIHKLFEWHADDFATTRIVAVYAYPENIKVLNNIVKKSCILSLEHMLILIIHATTVAISILDIGKNNRGISEKYIPYRQRLLYIVNNEIATFNVLNNIDKKVIMDYEVFELIKAFENQVNNFLNITTGNNEWNIGNNLDELSKKNVEEVYKLEEYYIENIKTSLMKYSRFDPLKKIY